MLCACLRWWRNAVRRHCYLQLRPIYNPETRCCCFFPLTTLFEYSETLVSASTGARLKKDLGPASSKRTRSAVKPSTVSHLEDGERPLFLTSNGVKNADFNTEISGNTIRSLMKSHRDIAIVDLINISIKTEYYTRAAMATTYSYDCISVEFPEEMATKESLKRLTLSTRT